MRDSTREFADNNDRELLKPEAIANTPPGASQLFQETTPQQAGISASFPDQEILKRLFALNLERSQG